MPRWPADDRALALSLGGLISATVIGVPAGTALSAHLGDILTVSTGVSADALPQYLMGRGLAGVAGNFGFARLIDSGRRPNLSARG